MVAVQPGSASTMLRKAGFEENSRQNFPGIQIVDKRYGMADFAKSLAAAENMLTAHPDMDALFASNESSTVGWLQAQRGERGHVELVGFDSKPTSCWRILRSRIDQVRWWFRIRSGWVTTRSRRR